MTKFDATGRLTRAATVCDSVANTKSQAAHRDTQRSAAPRAAVIAGLYCLVLCSAASAQDAAPAADPSTADVELPAVEVVSEKEQSKPKQQKYPSAKVAKKSPQASSAAAKQKPTPVPSATASAPTTEPSPQRPSGTAVEAPSSGAIPAVATTGSVIGDRQGLLDLSGSGHVTGAEELYTSHVFTTNEALRKVPGIVVRDEEGFGIRPNIGIRGMNPTRSTKTLLLEDGNFLTYAPYGDNASYFHPSLDRFESVEVIKGADQLLYGPQTISGTVNYITPNPPKEPAGFAALTGGNRDYLNGQFNYGGWSGPFGGLVDYVHKQGKGARDNTGHEINDIGVKGIAQVSSSSAFIAKLSYFNEDSQVTYSGITDAEARNFGIDYNPFKNDTFNTGRYAGSITNNWDLNDEVSVATTFHYNAFDREWWRQSSTTSDGQCGAGFRLDRANGIAVDPDTCNSTQGRLRYYQTRGLEQRWTWDYPATEAINNKLKAGFRVHSEDQERIQENGSSPTARSGTVVEDNERDVRAVSFFVQDRIDLGPFNITPAVRHESIDFRRQNNLTGASGSVEVSETIPGISVGYGISKNWSFFAGVHEGFAPPRVEDAIDNGGGSVEVDAEKSTNFEAGIRADPLPGLRFDTTYFRNGFDNLIAVGSIAGGAVNLAQGEALFEGFELFARADSARLMGTPLNFYGQVAWTYLWTAEQSTPFIRVDNGDPVAGDTAGNRQPYAPEHLVTARIGYSQQNFDAHVEMVYVGDQFADFQNFDSPGDATGTTNGLPNSQTGLFGKLDAYTIFNFGMTYTYEPAKTDIFFSVKNVFDDEYITDRTRGILPGAPRLFHVGLKQDF